LVSYFDGWAGEWRVVSDFGEGLKNPPVQDKGTEMSQNVELEGKLREYQKLFHLDHWRIDLEVVPDGMIDGSYGNVMTNYALERALIKVHDPAYSGNFDFKESVEATLLHEVIEVLLSDIGINELLNSKMKSQKERLIERIVKAIRALE